MCIGLIKEPSTNKPIDEVSDAIRISAKIALIALKCHTCRIEVRKLLTSRHQEGGRSSLQAMNDSYSNGVITKHDITT